MNLEQLRTLCLSMPHATEDVKWGQDLCFCVAEKMFLVTVLESNPASASFKVSDEDFELLQEKPGLKPAPYMARHKWIYVNDISRLSDNEWKYYVQQSYNLVKAKLPKKLQATLK
jgi:predicted DNA-binding protein (MmcQ/YjbR family)